MNKPELNGSKFNFGTGLYTELYNQCLDPQGKIQKCQKSSQMHCLRAFSLLATIRKYQKKITFVWCVISLSCYRIPDTLIANRSRNNDYSECGGW